MGQGRLGGAWNALFIKFYEKRKNSEEKKIYSEKRHKVYIPHGAESAETESTGCAWARRSW